MDFVTYRDFVHHCYSLIDKQASVTTLIRYLAMMDVCLHADGFSSNDLVYIYPIVLKGLSNDSMEFVQSALSSLLAILSMDSEKEVCFSFRVDQLLVAILRSQDKKEAHKSAEKCILCYLQGRNERVDNR